MSSPVRPETTKYVPVHLRAGFSGKGTAMPSNYTTATDAVGMALTKLGFKQGTGPNWYYPEAHPHIHVGKGVGGWFMAFSDGKQGVGGGGTSMVSGTTKMRNYAWGKATLLGSSRSDGVTLSESGIDVAVDGAYQTLLTAAS